MHSIYNQVFDDKLIVSRIRNKLPKLFQIAELECFRGGRIGMEIGSVREKIIIALLIYKFGIDIVNTNLKITLQEIDVEVQNQPLSIKTISSKTQKIMRGIKLAWTVDEQRAVEFKKEYVPKCDLMLAQIVWNGTGKLYLFSRQSQQIVLEKLGREEYIKLPKKSTNSRGVEISCKALRMLECCEDTRVIEIEFKRENVDYKKIYTKWLDIWREDF